MPLKTMGRPLVGRILSAAKRNYSAPADRSIPATKQKYVPTSGTYPKGFLAASAFAGVKPSNTKYDDMALIVSESLCPATAVFTRNRFKAAPVKRSRAYIDAKIKQGGKSNFRAVVVNSGCANAVTGGKGLAYADVMARTTDACLAPNASPTTVSAAANTWDQYTQSDTLVMSTGVIGQHLPIERITNAIPKLHESLGSTHQHWLNAANAICTTDTFPKLISRTFTLPSHPETTYSIAGMTKGAGMIHPNMGTLLGVVCTDAKVEEDTLWRLLRRTSEFSFNSISIDAETSTNDTVTLFANGAAAPSNVKPITVPRTIPKAGLDQDAAEFTSVLQDFMTDLAKLVVRDGEGATKFVTVKVMSDENYHVARVAAESIATSALVKTALYGKDANWGRILCAVGNARGIMSSFDPEESQEPKTTRQSSSQTQFAPIDGAVPDLDWSDASWKNTYESVNAVATTVFFVPPDGSQALCVLFRGQPQDVDEARAKQILEMEDIEIVVDLSDHRESRSVTKNPKPREKGVKHFATYYTCDLSHEYVTINGDYRT